MLAREGFLEVGGARLEYRTVPPAAPGRTTLVFLHEGLGCVAAWRDYPDLLAAATGLGALVYSRAGYGRSSPVPLPRSLRYHDAEAFEVLPRVLDLAGGGEAVLVGHSDGATIALLHAGADPGGRVKAVVAEAPHVFCEELSLAGIRKAVEAYERGDLRARLLRLHGDNVDVAFRGWSGPWLDPAFAAWSTEAWLPRLRAPVLVVQGRDDHYGSMAHAERIRAASGGPVDVLELEACGHTPHREQREATLQATAAFVRRALGG
jgi:pimeloyl-ACP methyl ester carboxylesterase